MWALIGGSGFENFEEFEVIEELDRDTPFGEASTAFKRVRLEGREILFLSRHGAHHEKLPSEVNYRANIYALKKYGAKAILSVSAIGSLQKEYKPGDMVVPTQYIDRTKGVRQHSFFGDGLIGHVSLAKPVSLSIIEQVQPLTKNIGFDCHFGATYVCIEGPYFSTKAESNFYRQIGANIIGMTNFPEYALAREAGISYVPCCFVTDYDCWDDSIPHVTVEEVITIMRQNNSKAFEWVKRVTALENPWAHCDASETGFKAGLFMPPEAIPKDKKPWVDVLINGPQ
ncbi:MAG: MTAP family purine nucleoside phosphorylase [Bdellovibrionales bacterium]